MKSGQRRAATLTKASVRVDLVTAAQRLLMADGPEGLTSRSIADEAEANLASITYYFGSKDQLVAEAMIAVARDLIEPVVAQLSNSDGDPVTNLLTTAQLLYRVLAENRDQLPGYVHALAAASNDDRIGDGIQKLHHCLRVVLAESIAGQRELGLLPAWVDPEAMAQLILAVGNGVVIAKVTDPDRTDEVAIGTQFAQLLIAARG